MFLISMSGRYCRLCTARDFEEDVGPDWQPHVSCGDDDPAFLYGGRCDGHLEFDREFDDGIISIDHTVALYQALPNGRLAIIPGASHTSFLEHPGLVERIIRDFIADPGPLETMMPIRRA